MCLSKRLSAGCFETIYCMYLNIGIKGIRDWNQQADMPVLGVKLSGVCTVERACVTYINCVLCWRWESNDVFEITLHCFKVPINSTIFKIAVRCNKHWNRPSPSDISGTWLKYCRYGVNQSINHIINKLEHTNKISTKQLCRLVCVSRNKYYIHAYYQLSAYW